MIRRTLLAALTALSITAATAGAEELLVDGIAAQVGNRIVLVSEVMRFVGPQEAAMRAGGAPESEIAKVRASALEHLIESKLIEELVQRAELHATDEEVDATIASIAQENGLTIEQLEASVVFHGMAFDEYRAQIKRDLERRNVVNAVVGSKVSIEEADVRRLYAERYSSQPQGGVAVHVRQLLVTFGGPSKRDPAHACALVAAAQQRIRDGEEFTAVARDVSEVAPQDGGDIGWLHLDSVAPWMSNALATLEPGGVSDIVELPFGCTLLNLVERREFAPVTFEQASDALSQELWERALEAGYREWIDELRGNTYIDRRGYFAEAAHFGDRPFTSAPDPGPDTP